MPPGATTIRELIQGHERQHRVAHQAEERVVQEPWQRGDGVVAPFEGADAGGEDEIHHRHHDEQRDREHIEKKKRGLD